jgi:hypothetical protein
MVATSHTASYAQLHSLNGGEGCVGPPTILRDLTDVLLISLGFADKKVH